MLTNRKLLAIQIILFKVFIAFHASYFVFFCLSYINRNYLEGEMLSSKQGLAVGQVMAVLWGIHQVLNILSLILMIIWFYRANKNAKTIHATKRIHPFWIFTFWIAPFMEVIFPVLFVRRYLSVVETEVKINQKQFRNKYWLILVLGIIGYLMSLVPFVGPFLAQLVDHKYLYIIGITLWIKPVFLIGYCILWLSFFRQLQNIDQQLIANHANQSYLSESTLIDN